MTVENQSSIRFTVEESIWFQKGQEVSDLLSMSLDPEISIQEHEQYISVRGGLVLTGEYHARITDEREENVELPANARVVQEVTRGEDGVSYLKHKFPVDITIPKNRIQSLNDVYVSIESFDYELPRNGNLLLEAELSITGIYGDLEETALQPQVSEKVVTVNLPDFNQEDKEQQSTVNEWKVEREEELVQPLMRGFDEEVEEEQEGEEDPFTPFVVEAKRDPRLEAASEEVTEEVVEDINEQGPEVSSEDQSVQEEDIVQEDVGEASEEDEEEEAYVFTRQTPQFEFKSRVDSENTNVESKDEVSEQGNRDENTLYLTKIFTKDDESETTRLKLYIVQKDESIDSIAERYDVQPQTLIRVNNLDREHLAAGQILYIPVPAVSGK